MTFGTYTFTPTLNFNGTVSLNYGVTDGNETLTAVTNSFSVTPINDAPTAGTDSLTATQFIPIKIPVTTLLANDSDVDGDALKITKVSNAQGGAAVLFNNFTPNTFRINPTISLLVWVKVNSNPFPSPFSP